MPVDFFSGTCQNGVSSRDITTAALFGLCDDIPRNRAYIDTASPPKWIAIVENSPAYEVTFTSIDNCIEIRRPDGTMESRCDGMLTYDDSIVFVELKEKNRGWLEEGLGQLETTLLIFKATHPERTYASQRVCLANSRHPLFAAGRATHTQEFKDKTGIVPLIQNKITL
ncbi:MAG: hypothetical protein ACRYFX_13150 [Janthinobacterium lividum]